MSLIGSITLINQNSHISSLIASDYMSREILHKQLQELKNSEQSLNITKIKPIEKIEKISKDHINIKA